jgi:hypothetical protein
MNKVEFTPPKEFVAPAGTEAGKQFDLVCTFESKQGGTLCLVQLGDTKMPGYDGKDNESKPDYKQYAQAMTQQPEPAPAGQPGMEGQSGGY